MIYLSPEHFLLLAEDGECQDKAKAVEELLIHGVPFNSVPFLYFRHDGEGVAEVVGHEGRHRARALRKLGVTEMPVRLISREDGKGAGIRWGLQDTPGRNQITGKWPVVLLSESEDKNSLVSSIPFPVPDMRAAPTVQT